MNSRALKPRPSIEPDRLEAVMRELADGVGVRLAGTAGEEEAIRRIVRRFRDAGAPTVEVESFPVRARVVEYERLWIRMGGRWRAFPCSLFSNTPGTGGRPIEAPLLFFESPGEYRRPDLTHLRGKAVVHVGCHIESRESYRRLLEARPAFLLFVDVRFPGTVPLADGMFPAYTRALGAVPVVNVAYMDAWTWERAGAEAARLCVQGGMRSARSANVIAELPGEDPEAGVILLGAHHDTQADSPGADDNASGVASLVELCRVLAPLARRRTIRLISFGAEEQLSEGSAYHVRRHRARLARQGRIMVNFDSLGSGMGLTEVWCHGPAVLARVMRRVFARRGLYPEMKTDLVPYADHFPFVAAGIPGVWIWRRNCEMGRFFHHRPDDDMSRVSPGRMAAILEPVADVLADWALRKTLPFSAAWPTALRKRAAAMWRDLFGGWAVTGRR